MWIQQTLNNSANCDYFFTKLSGIDPCEKQINIPGENTWCNLFMACSKLVAIATYLSSKTDLWALMI